MYARAYTAGINYAPRTGYKGNDRIRVTVIIYTSRFTSRQTLLNIVTRPIEETEIFLFSNNFG